MSEQRTKMNIPKERITRIIAKIKFGWKFGMDNQDRQIRSADKFDDMPLFRNQDDIVSVIADVLPEECKVVPLATVSYAEDSLNYFSNTAFESLTLDEQGALLNCERARVKLNAITKDDWFFKRLFVRVFLKFKFDCKTDNYVICGGLRKPLRSALFKSLNSIAAAPSSYGTMILAQQIKRRIDLIDAYVKAP